MSKKPSVSSIPWWVVLAAIVLAAPAGVVLAVLKILLDNAAKKSAVSRKAAEEMSIERGEKRRRGNENTRETHPRRKLKRRSTALRIVAVVHLVCAAILSCVALGDAIAGNTAAVMESIAPNLYFSLFGAVAAVLSVFLLRYEQDAARYVAVIGEKDSVSLMKLAEATSCRIAKVKRDMQKLINDGVFGESAYIDASNLCFMRHPDAIPDGVAEAFGDVYSRSMSSTARDLGADDKEVSASANADEIGIVDYDFVLKNIRKLDDVILNEAVSVRIQRIEIITRHIFEYVAQKPEKKPQIRMFMNYYLPTTLKLLEAYSRIERVGVAGENMRDAKANIEKTLDMLVAGFEQQFDLLYRAESVDISSDIEVLEQMMSRDGLKTNTDFSPAHSREVPGAAADGYSDEFSDDLTAGGTAAKKDL